MAHTAKIVPGSIEDLGPNGIAFSVMCCDDPKNIQRHTLAYAHTLTIEELEQVIVRRYLMPHEQTHAKTMAHAAHVERLAANFGQRPQGPDLEDCENCR